jgi:CubicO group peptidase (beta-lactamase class C family)
MSSSTKILIGMVTSALIAGVATLIARRPAPPEHGTVAIPAANSSGTLKPAPDLMPPPASVRPMPARSALDELVDQQMRRFNLPGAAVVVVHQGRVVHARGYGVAEIETGRALDAERSVFRTASISKLFTATAVMQLVEQGRLDLDDNVSVYLDFEIPPTRTEPITLRHLLTHTAGFDERLLGSSASRTRPEAMLTLRQGLTARDAAPRVRPPGELISYSNHGIALAGYIVERVSGMPFAEYIDAHVHAPLRMNRSTFAEPLPEALQRDRVRGYVFHKGGYERLPIVYENGAPAGSHFSTGHDIARFMLAHLNEGELDGARVLGAETARRMHAQTFTHHPRLPGWTLGFTEYRIGGWRAIGHGGDLPGAHSQLILVPEAGLGVFVHYNGEWAIRIDDDPRMHIVQHVASTFLPEHDTAGRAALPTLQAPAAGLTEAGVARVTGNYRYSRHAKTSIEKLLLPNAFVRLHVEERPDGRIRMHMPLGLMDDTEWERVEPLLYRRVGGDEHLAFRADADGRATHLFPTLMIPVAFERVRWFESEKVLLSLLGFSALAFLGASLDAPAAALARRLRRRAAAGFAASERRRRRLGRAVGVTGGGTLAVLGLMAAQAVTTGDTPLLPLQPLLAGAVGVCGLLTLGLGYSTAQAWMRGEETPPRRVGYTGLTLAGAAFVAQMAYFNVLSP